MDFVRSHNQEDSSAKVVFLFPLQLTRREKGTLRFQDTGSWKNHWLLSRLARPQNRDSKGRSLQLVTSLSRI